MRLGDVYCGKDKKNSVVVIVCLAGVLELLSEGEGGGASILRTLLYQIDCLYISMSKLNNMV